MLNGTGTSGVVFFLDAGAKAPAFESWETSSGFELLIVCGNKKSVSRKARTLSSLGTTRWDYPGHGLVSLLCVAGRVVNPTVENCVALF